MHKLTAVVIAVLILAAALAAQQPATAPSTTVPRLVRVANTFHPASGTAGPVESVTLSIYQEEQGGTALWSETQNVAVDAEGRYAVLMGSTLADGVPADLFTTGEPRWLGVQFNRPGEAEQPRTQLVSVPYALKAVDAETLGGKPASSYLLAPSVAEASAGDAAAKLTNSGSTATPAVKSAKPQVASGMTNCIGVFTNSTDLGCSVMWQSGFNIGIDTMNPGTGLDVGAGSIRVAGYSAPSSGAGLEMAYIGANNSGYLFAYDRAASAAKDLNIGGSGAAITVKASGNVGVGTATPGSNLDVAGDINLSGTIFAQGKAVLRFLPNAFGNSIGVGTSTFLATTGFANTALGDNALLHNTTGSYETALGVATLPANTTGQENTAAGYGALYSNTSGSNNAALGAGALASNTIGVYNTAVGEALGLNTSGGFNISVGETSMTSNLTGSNNTAVGFRALGANQSGNSNIGLGYYAGSSMGAATSGGIYIGSIGAPGDSGAIRIGGTSTNGDTVLQSSFFAAGIRGVTTGSNNAVPVLIDSNGQLGTVSSSRRYKEDIHDMGMASRGLMRLRPVTFRYKKPFEDGSKPIQYGLIAEEVAEVYPDLVARGADGQIETVKYQLLPTMLLNEVQRQERTIQEQQRSMEQQAREIEQLKAKLAALSSLEARLAVLESATAAGNR